MAARLRHELELVALMLVGRVPKHVALFGALLLHFDNARLG